MTAEKTRTKRWTTALRAFPVFLLGGGLGSVAYRAMSGHSGPWVNWGGLLFGAIVFTTLSVLFRGRRRSRP